MIRLRALVLDLGEVLVHPQPAELVRHMAETAATPLAAFTAAYWAHRDEYDLAGNARRYWDAVLQDAGSPLREASRDLAVPRLTALDAESWTQYREEVWEIARGFREAGGQTALLSNCGPEVIERLRSQKVTSRYFDAMVVSWEVGCLKPDPAIYQLTLAKLVVRAEEALFVDDRPPNVAGAQAVGMQAMLFSGADPVSALRERALRAG